MFQKVFFPVVILLGIAGLGIAGLGSAASMPEKPRSGNAVENLSKSAPDPEGVYYGIEKVTEILLTLGYHRLEYSDDDRGLEASAAQFHEVVACQDGQAMKLKVNRWAEIVTEQNIGPCIIKPIMITRDPNFAKMDDFGDIDFDEADFDEADLKKREILASNDEPDQERSAPAAVSVAGLGSVSNPVPSEIPALKPALKVDAGRSHNTNAKRSYLPPKRRIHRRSVAKKRAIKRRKVVKTRKRRRVRRNYRAKRYVKRRRSKRRVNVRAPGTRVRVTRRRIRIRAPFVNLSIRR